MPIKRLLIEIYGVSFEVTLKGGESITQLFPILHLAPRIRTNRVDWRILVSCVKRISTHCDGNASLTSVLRIYPDTDVTYCIDNKHNLYASTQRAELCIQPSTKVATLSYRADGVTDAEYLAKLAVVEILRREGLYAVHAGAVEFEGGAVLICATSGMGKSTLTASWAAIGSARFIADDQCVILKQAELLWVGGLSDSLALSPDSEKILTNLGMEIPSPHTRFDNKHQHDAHDLFMQVCNNPYPAKALIFLVDPSEGMDDIRPCPPELAAQYLLASSFYLGHKEIMQKHFETAIDLTAQVPAYFASHGMDCRRFVARIEKELTASSPQAIPIYSSVHQRAPKIPLHRMEMATQRLAGIVSGTTSSEKMKSWGARDWIDVTKLANHHGCLALLRQIIKEKWLLKRLHPGVRKTMEMAAARVHAIHQTHLAMIDMLLKAFESRKIQWIIINGPAIAERFYQIPETRCYHHLDIVVASDKRNAAADALREIGYAPTLNRGQNITQAAQPTMMFAHESLTLHKIHLHTDYGSLNMMRNNGAVDISDLIQRKEFLDVGKRTFPVANKIDQMVLSCTQMVNSHQWNNLNALLDVALMAKQASEPLLMRVKAKALQQGYYNVVALAIRQAMLFFWPKDPQSPSRKMRPSLSALVLSALVFPKPATARPWRRLSRFRRYLLLSLVKKGLV